MNRGSVGGSGALRLGLAAVLLGLGVWYWRDLPFAILGHPQPPPAWLIRYVDSDIIRFQGSVAAAGLVYLLLLLLTASFDRLRIDDDTTAINLGEALANLSWGERNGFEYENEEGARDDLEWVLDQRRQVRTAPLTFTVWLLPVLGFIGTVVGISDAIEGLEASGTSPGGVRDFTAVFAGLHVAFDTTLVGLVLAIPLTALLMFLNLLLQAVDRRLIHNILPRGQSVQTRVGLEDAPQSLPMSIVTGRTE